MLLALVSLLVCSCGGGPLREVQVHENVSTVVEGHNVAAGRIVRHHRYRKGTRVDLFKATIFVREGAGIRTYDVVQGDDVVIGSVRWIVVDVIPGDSTSLGAVLLKQADETR